MIVVLSGAHILCSLCNHVIPWSLWTLTSLARKSTLLAPHIVQVGARKITICFALATWHSNAHNSRKNRLHLHRIISCNSLLENIDLYWPIALLRYPRAQVHCTGIAHRAIGHSKTLLFTTSDPRCVRNYMFCFAPEPLSVRKDMLFIAPEPLCPQKNLLLLHYATYP